MKYRRDAQPTETLRMMQRAATVAWREFRRYGPVPPYARPQTRADCATFGRPCPYVGCLYNLSLEVTPAGSIKYLMGTDWEALADGPSNCALDRADEGGLTLSTIGQAFGVSRECIRQEEEVALAKLEAQRLSH